MGLQQPTSTTLTKSRFAQDSQDPHRRKLRQQPQLQAPTLTPGKLTTFLYQIQYSLYFIFSILTLSWIAFNLKESTRHSLDHHHISSTVHILAHIQKNHTSRIQDLSDIFQVERQREDHCKNP